jgi:Uncharacterized conserved protein (DUF2203)
MKRNPRRSKQRRQKVKLWTYAQAQTACPYIRAVVGSLREHAVEVLTLQRQVKHMADSPGRPDRTALIAFQEAEHQLQSARDRFEQTADELDTLNLYSLDPVQGQALIPFVHDEQLAWYIFDLFDNKPLRFWRYQNDSEETRRPVAVLSESTQRM